ncbi:hypothetical protein F4803DRAFT_539817 [Xylaria telfairii]|nr:hypothetical protein F4803DRAFT_539817 [Xylaria telfairii]
MPDLVVVGLSCLVPFCLSLACSAHDQDIPTPSICKEGQLEGREGREGTSRPMCLMPCPLSLVPCPSVDISPPIASLPICIRYVGSLL